MDPTFRRQQLVRELGGFAALGVGFLALPVAAAGWFTAAMDLRRDEDVIGAWVFCFLCSIGLVVLGLGLLWRAGQPRPEASNPTERSRRGTRT